MTFLVGGEMGARIRRYDWSSSPLGPVPDWPRSLKTAVGILLHSRYPMFVWWGPGLVNLYNDAYIPVLGRRHPDALGRCAREVWSDVWPVVGPQAREVLEQGRATWNEERQLLMERNQFLEETYFTFSYSPVSDDQGKVGGVFCVCTEDTQRVLGQRRLRTLRALAERTAEAKTADDACDLAAATLSENPHDLPFALLYLLDGQTGRARLAGTAGPARPSPAGPAEVFLDDPDAPWPFREVAATGAAALVEDLSGRLGAPPGGSRPEPPRRAAVLPVAKPGVSRPAGFIVAGLSPRLAFTDDYRGFLDLVAGQVATAVGNARAFEEEKRRAESLAELDRAKTAFFSNISHEFRTPLTLMLGPIEELLSGPPGSLPATVRGQLEMVDRNGLRLLRLVNTLLDFSRIEAGRVRAVYEPTDLATLTADVASIFRSAVERAGLELIVECGELPEPVFVDRDMWEKIVLNLISNALKFTFDGGITVSLRMTEEAVELQVRDTGTGIPAEEMPRLFERFHRIRNARARTHEGSGIGLALVQELARLHGGSIRAESVVDVGTTIHVSVPRGSAHLPAGQIAEARALGPVKPDANSYVEEALRWLPGREQVEEGQRAVLPVIEEPGAAPLPREPGAGRPCVMLADDNADMRQYLFRLLSGHLSIEAFADGEAALAAARNRPPDLILTDVMMPRLDGFGLLRELRADPRTRDVPVILLSARAGEESRVEGMEAGADDYLVKPFSARELLARVDAHLKMARMRREAVQALRESEQRLQSFADTAPAMLWITGPDGACTFLSRGWLEFTGQTEQEALGFGWLDAVHPSDREEAGRVYREANARGEPFSLDYRLRRSDGHHRWAIDRGRPRFDGQGRFLGYIGSVIDVHERKLAEQELQEADRRKDEFLATLAHELRNPLAPLRNGLHLMKAARDRPEIVEKARGMMERQLHQMIRLIDDLLDLSRISRGIITLRKERVSLNSVIRQALETSRPAIEQGGHELSILTPGDEVPVHADTTRLAQVFSNLLHNAAKFTPAGGHVSVAVERDGSHAVVRIRDDGAGIPAQMLDRVFDMFTQLDRSLERSQGGLGIGLTLVKRLVEMHGGTVEARSDGEGKGSEFLVRLPAAAPRPGEEEARPYAPAPAVPGRRILVVDDNRDAALSLMMLLNVMGHQTRMACDGLEAMDVGAEFQPHVILLDIGMPRLNGYDAARRIRQEAWGRTILLVALTGWGQEDDRQRSRDAGFDFHVVKPVEPAALQRLLAGMSQAAT